ncbi:MAG: universal stress protein, partial [Maribacter sp.]|nr:universal stress protein [Maribacter sp.]
SAIRTINRESNAIDKKIQSIAKSFSDDFGVKISYSFAIGNLKNEIDAYIREQKPDIIVLQRKKTKVLDFLGDNITQFVHRRHRGAIFIVDDKNIFEPNKELSLALLDNGEGIADIEFMDSLLSHTQKPLKSFKIVKNPSGLKASNEFRGKKTIEFVFEERDDSIKNLSKYLMINNINLLCVGRTKNNPAKKSDNSSINSDINAIVGNLEVPLLLSEVPQ